MTAKRTPSRRFRAVPHTERPIGVLSSLKTELAVIITISTAIAFVMAWFLLKFGWSGWIAMPLTLIVSLGITYFFSRGLTSPLRQMRDAAKAMADGDYTVRVHTGTDSNDEVGQLARSFNEMAEELEHADQMRRDMVANVSHELRTPVSALQAMVENMADGIVEPTPANLESIRMEAGAASLQIEWFDFREFIDDTVEPLEIADGGHGHTIRVLIPEDIRMEGDQDRLRQLFTNIIANALKHSADGTEVLIEAREDEDEGVIVTNVVNYGGGAIGYLPALRQGQNRSGHGIGRHGARAVHRTMGGAAARRHRRRGRRFPRRRFRDQAAEVSSRATESRTVAASGCGV